MRYDAARKDGRYSGGCRRPARIWELAAMVAVYAFYAVLTPSVLAWESANSAQKEPGKSGAADQLAVPVGVLAQFNRGAALMEQYKYSKAAEEFAAVLEEEPDWVAARFNFGLANLNKDTERSREEAVEAFRAVLEADPGNLHALFCLGMYHQHMGAPERALVCFARVHWGDPTDPHVAFKFAETLIDTQREQQGVEVLEKVVEMDPGFISALYRLGLQYRRAQGNEKAGELLARFQELHAAEVAGGAFAVQKVYGTVGKYYTVLGADSHPMVRTPDKPVRRIVFSPEVEEFGQPTSAWKWTQGAIGMPGLAVADVDGDGHLDVFLTAIQEDGGGTVWLNSGTGEFTAASTIDEPCVSASFGDVDNDGDVDLWLGCAGAARLFNNDGQGTFTPGGFSSDSPAETLTPLSPLLD
ncbi:MAG: FG-GAP-like repeat-containing protein, partial [Planctomycetota bacterium]